jgi:hypothetical protein
MSSPLPRLDPKLDQLMESERSAPSPGDALERVWSRLAESVSDSSSSSGGQTERPSGVAPVRTPWGPGITLVALLVGVGAGALLHAVLRPPPPERLVYVDRVAQPPEPTPEPVPTHAPAPVSSLAPVPLPPLAPAPSTPASTLSEERALLERARTALTEGDAARAVTLTDAHAHRYPRPHFGEEREAIAIQALVIGGRYTEARARAARFEAQFPNSLFRPVLEASLSSIP